MALELEIQEIIKKNLPEQIGQTLKTRLDKADVDAKKVDLLSQNLLDRDVEIKSLKAEIQKYMKFDTRNSNLDEREKQIESKERSLAIEELKYQLQSEKDKTKFAQDVALGLVRNLEYRSKVFDSKSGPDGVDQYGQAIYATHTVHKDETKTID